MSTLLKELRVAAPPAAVEMVLPLTSFDIMWLTFHPIRRLLFYKFPCSSTDFLVTVVPRLQDSLSTTLKHYLPLAGKIIYPLDGETKPTIRYSPGDSVSLTVHESDEDFDNLVGNHARDADVFYDFIAMLPTVTESGNKLIEVLAVKITLFSERGICIGVANHHTAGDANSILRFIRSWATVSKLGGDEELVGESLPLIDRSLIKDPRGIDSIYLNAIKGAPIISQPFPLPTNRFRSTFTLSPSDLTKLKDLVKARIPDLVHVSSFVVMAAYIWSCLARSLVTNEEEEVADDEPELFVFAVDIRSRIDPPLPENYFGNCLSYGLAEVRHGELVADGDGFFAAVDAIADQIKNRVNDREKILEDVEDWMTVIPAFTAKRVLSVSGSARADLYSADFGWGAARKTETLSVDGQEYAMALCRDPAGGLEIGLSLPEKKMEAFAANFAARRKEVL